MPNIVLRTACGCEQLRAWPLPLPPEIRVPTYRPTGLFYQGDEFITHPLPARRFVARGIAENGCPLYREFDEVVVDRPAAPRLTNNEWASAVARFQRDHVLTARYDEDVKRAASWVTADLDFLARHDGGVVVYHQSGMLVGAFYPAPSWDASDECVRFWSALRATMATMPKGDW